MKQYYDTLVQKLRHLSSKTTTSYFKQYDEKTRTGGKGILVWIKILNKSWMLINASYAQLPSHHATADTFGPIEKCGAGHVKFSALHTVHKDFFLPLRG